MARTVAGLAKGARITDYISIGVISKNFPLEKVNEILRRTGKISQRQRDLPAHVVIYYVLALALFMQVSYREVLRCLLEGLLCHDPTILGYKSIVHQIGDFPHHLTTDYPQDVQPKEWNR